MPLSAAAFFRARVRAGRLRLVDQRGGEVVCGRPSPVLPDAAMSAISAAQLWKYWLSPDPFFLRGYVDGEWRAIDCEIEDVLVLLEANLRFESSPLRAALAAILRAPFAVMRGPRAARFFAARHYDRGDDLYFSFLDPRHLQYSCAFFDDEHPDLESAQQNKIDLTLARLQIGVGARTLDIGCGWGGLAREIVRRFDSRVLGVTLSANQLAHARAAASELSPDEQARLEFELVDYRAAPIGEGFDRVVSVGMFEHVGLSRYRDYFAAVARALKVGGLALVHTIARPRPGTNSAWTAANIFPGGFIPALSQILAPIEAAGLRVESVFWHRGENYQKTLRAWRRNYRANRAALDPQKYDERFHRLWEMYFAACIYVFDARAQNYGVAQIVLRKDRA